MKKMCLIAVMCVVSAPVWAGPVFDSPSEFRQCAQDLNVIVHHKSEIDTDKEWLEDYKENTRLMGNWIELQRPILYDNASIARFNAQVDDYKARVKEIKRRRIQINAMIDQQTSRLRDLDNKCGGRQVDVNGPAWKEVCVGTSAYSLFCGEFQVQ